MTGTTYPIWPVRPMRGEPLLSYWQARPQYWRSHTSDGRNVLRHKIFGDLPALDPIQKNNAVEYDMGASS